jgi:hypothetical protein
LDTFSNFRKALSAAFDLEIKDHVKADPRCGSETREETIVHARVRRYHGEAVIASNSSGKKTTNVDTRARSDPNRIP